jgi:hypothetical protein
MESKTGSARAILMGSLFLLADPGSVLAQPSEAQILDALRSRSTRAISGSPEQQHRSAEERRFIDSLRRRSARSLTLGERGKIAEFTRDKPSIDIEINFEYNSKVVGPKALRPLLALGRALANEQLKGTVFFINGHTDAKGALSITRTSRSAAPRR